MARLKWTLGLLRNAKRYRREFAGTIHEAHYEAMLQRWIARAKHELEVYRGD